MTDYNYRKSAVLFVDDEEKARKYFTQAFEDDFTILTAASAKEARAIIDAPPRPIGVVITDQRMPNETGVDLLGYVRNAKPEITRILTTAYSDLDSAIDAVNSGSIFKYIVKPWNLKEVRGSLMRAMEFYLIQEERDTLLREKMSTLQRLVVVDRMRALTVLAASLATHFENSMTALQSFLRMVPSNIHEKGSLPSAENSSLSDLMYATVHQECDQVVRVINEVIQATRLSNPGTPFDDVIELDSLFHDNLIAATSSQKGILIQRKPYAESTKIKVNYSLIQQLFTILLNKMIMISERGSTVTVRAGEPVKLWGTDGVRVTITSDGKPWTDEQVAEFFTAFHWLPYDAQSAGTDLLTAFFICYHHGGDIMIHKTSSTGPGFELQIPLDPKLAKRPSLETGYLEKLFTRFEL